MKIFCTASTDTYITDKIINGQFRVEDANVGRAGTLDLFKLWGETKLNSSGSLNELSRLLIKFDYSKIQNLTSSKIDLNSSNFKAKMKLFDMRSGAAVPANFSVAVFPLSQSFDEGVGRDVVSFGDIDASNYLTASTLAGAAVSWNVSGANGVGTLGDSSIDIISQANFGDGNGLGGIFSSQKFVQGTEDLSVDVTRVVSATVAGQMPNFGFRVSFSGSDETDTKTRFVKRFASRHVSDATLRPRVEVSFDDSLQDNHSNFFFDISGSLFLNSFGRSSSANIVSGSALTSIVGTNCLMLKLKSGSYSYVTTASQASMGTIDSDGKNFMTGVYSASFAIPSNDSTTVDFGTTLAQMVARTGSITFEEYWYSLDKTVGYHTGSLTIKRTPRYSANFISQEPIIHVTNLNHEYHVTDQPRLRIFGRDIKNEQNSPKKIPISLFPIIFDEVYYRVRDMDSGRIVVNFGETDNSTRVSTDSQGMFFDFHMDVLPQGRAFLFDFLVINRGTRTIVRDPQAQFAVR